MFIFTTKIIGKTFFYECLGRWIILSNYFFKYFRLAIFKNICFFLVFSQILLNKRIKKPRQTIKQISSILNEVINMFVITLLVLKLGNCENTTNEIMNTLTKIGIKAKNPSNVPISSLWLNHILWRVGLGCVNESIEQGRSYYNMNINISNCFFSRFSLYIWDGGVIYATQLSRSMYVNNSMFYNCSARSGGAIFYYGCPISFLRMICANRCFASSWCHFALTKTEFMSHMEFLSVSHGSDEFTVQSTILIKNGDQRVDNTNCSMNNANYISGIDINSPTIFTSSHCTYSNNKASGFKCISCFSSYGSILISYANIVHNNSPSEYGVVYTSGNTLKTMMH